MTIDLRQGIVTFDGPALLPDAVALLVERAPKMLRGSGEATTVAPEAILSAELRGRYQRLVGAEVEGMPVLVPVGVAVTDGRHELAMLRHQAVLPVPEAAVAEQLAKRAAEPAPAEAEPGPVWAGESPWDDRPDRGLDSLDTTLKVMLVVALLVASFAVALVAIAIVIFLIVRMSRSRPARPGEETDSEAGRPATSQPVELEPLDEPDAEDSSTED
jgi:hypothetical protein